MTISKRNTHLFRTFVYLMLLIISYLFVANFSDARMKQKASQFCNQAMDVGDVAGLTSAALAAGATMSEAAAASAPESATHFVATFPGLAPFDGYACDVQIKNDRAIASSLSELDL
jgi:hypothetical protein